MNTTKQTAIIGLIVAVAVGAAVYLRTSNETPLPARSESENIAPAETGDMNDAVPAPSIESGDAARMPITPSEPSTPPGKLKVINFVGKLESINTGCFVDGECYVIVGGKHITTTLGWRQEVVGSSDLDLLNKHIGKNVHVYAQDKGDGTYTLYGSEGFYVKPE